MVSMCASLWRMVVEVTSLKSSHWWGPACDPWPLRHINHNPLLLAFISPAESYCPASTPTPPFITSLLQPFIRLSSTSDHRYHSITTHLSGAALISQRGLNLEMGSLPLIRTAWIIPGSPSSDSYWGMVTGWNIPPLFCSSADWGRCGRGRGVHCREIWV